MKYTEGELLNILVKAKPNIYKETELGMLMISIAKRRQKIKKPINIKYFKWLYNELKEVEG